MKEIEAGQKIRLKVKTSPIKMESISCTVKWYEKDRVALVLPDESRKIIRNLPEGKELEAVWYSDAGIYVFDSMVINSPLEHDFVIELPDEKKHVQRRDYVRVPLHLSLILTRSGRKIEAHTVNIGGGGIRFAAKNALGEKEEWDFSLLCPDGKQICGKGAALYSIIHLTTVISAIKFTDILENDRSKIIKMCFEEEARVSHYKTIP